MNIYGKSAANVEQLQIRNNRGFEKYELQLLSEMITDDGILNAEDAYDLPAIAQFNVYAVHSPLIPTGDVNLEHMLRGPKAKLLEQCFYISEYLAKARMRDITLIVHTRYSLWDFENTGLWNDCVVVLGLLLNKYPHVHLAIENVIPFSNKTKEIRFSNNCKFDNIELAEKLRLLLDTDRVGTVLDTCHAMMTKKYVEVLYKAINDDRYPMENLSLDEYFRRNAETCKLIHCSNMIGNGMQVPEHGAPFLCDRPEDVALLTQIIKSYVRYGLDCPITLEVGEIDIMSPINYSKTYMTLLSVFDKLEKASF